jgi:hypothetical protein
MHVGMFIKLTVGKNLVAHHNSGNRFLNLHWCVLEWVAKISSMYSASQSVSISCDRKKCLQDQEMRLKLNMSSFQACFGGLRVT